MITVGDTVSYRKVGRAVVTEIIARSERSVLVKLRFITGPAKYRSGELADGEFWIPEEEV